MARLAAHAVSSEGSRAPSFSRMIIMDSPEIQVMLWHWLRWMGIRAVETARGHEGSPIVRPLPQDLAANLTPKKLTNSWRNGVPDLAMLTPVVAHHLEAFRESLNTTKLVGREMPAAPVKGAGGRTW